MPTYYDVRFVEVSTDSRGVSFLTLERNGEPLRLLTIHARDATGEHPWLRAGDIGVAETVSAGGYPRELLSNVPELIGESFYRFTAYHDQTLRRCVELDAPDHDAIAAGRVPDVIGWRCDGRNDGFRAPVGLVPGKDGLFVRDQTDAITLRIPPEFAALCRDFGLTAVDVLRGFIADVAALQNYFALPRADGYSSNGSDERGLAQQWLWRAYGHLYEDEQQRIAEKERTVEAMNERLADLESIEMAVDDYCDSGGTIDELREHIQNLIERRGRP